MTPVSVLITRTNDRHINFLHYEYILPDIFYHKIFFFLKTTILSKDGEFKRT